MEPESYLHLESVEYILDILDTEQHGITPKGFIEIDNECDVLGFLLDGYEPFHLTGPQGVLQEVEAYIALKPA